MRRRISLYIGDMLADLDDQSFILFNFTMEDLSNPTIVKNSFSQQVSLPGTPQNNRIFGEYFRLDRHTEQASGDTGVAFNPAVKTPFTIFDEASEILESGYCKLDEVTRRGGIATYKVTLYGGLGSFLYSLSYNGNGQKRTLADLDYLGDGDPAELDFVIDATSLADAWQDLSDLYYGAEPAPTGKWTVVNFAPTYQGFPDNFSADKGIVQPAGVGLPDNLGGYSSSNTGGYALVNLVNKVDEWAAKDIRSYLQRPVLSMKAFLDAVCNPNNNGGYQVDISSLTGYGFQYKDLWLTLPTIPSLGSMKQDGTSLSLTMSTSATAGNGIARWDIVGAVPYGAKVSANIRCKIRLNMPSGANSYNSLKLTGASGNDASSSIIFTQVVAYASDNTVVGGSPVKIISTIYNADKRYAEVCGFTPAFPTDEYTWEVCDASKISAGIFELDNELSYDVEAQDVAYYRLMVYVYEREKVVAYDGTTFVYSGDGSTSTPTLYASYSTHFDATSAYIVAGSGNTISMTNPDSLRSGALITKQMLLSTSGTPADYLLSFCKMFGLYFVTDTAEKKVTILRRNDLYQNETIDLTGMVDVSQDIVIVPLLFDSKWYRFKQEGVGGAFFKEYEEVYGFDYGIQLIETGYDFNADVKDLLDSSVYRNAVSVLASSRYWNYIDNSGTFVPSPFLDTGNTYSLRNSAGDSQEFQISCPPASATITYYNATYNGYDKATEPKLQLHDADGKPVDGRDVLVFLNGFSTYTKFKITDDLPVMGVLNGGTPCWILDEGSDVDLPMFSRYGYSFVGLNKVMTDSLDFGVPRELDIPSIVYEGDETIYARGWRKYLTDRYDVDTTIMRCRVRFTGLQVGQDLLRKFYYYGNTLWVLNRIINYSMTTFDPVECEFIRVQDIANYLNGQDY